VLQVLAHPAGKKCVLLLQQEGSCGVHNSSSHRVDGGWTPGGVYKGEMHLSVSHCTWLNIQFEHAIQIRSWFAQLLLSMLQPTAVGTGSWTVRAAD
jgi:hypothetical protein